VAYQGGRSVYCRRLSELSLIQEYSEYDLLVLDDIGVEKNSEWVQQTLTNIIDKRYSEMRCTVFTSNCELGEIETRLSTRIASRIAGMCVVVRLAGSDRRVLAKGVRS